MINKIFKWFVSEGDTVVVACFRMMVSLFCIIKMIAVKDYFFYIYGQYGYVQWAITKSNLLSGIPHLGDFAIFLRKVSLV